MQVESGNGAMSVHGSQVSVVALMEEAMCKFGSQVSVVALMEEAMCKFSANV